MRPQIRPGVTMMKRDPGSEAVETGRADEKVRLHGMGLDQVRLQLSSEGAQVRNNSPVKTTCFGYWIHRYG